LKKTSNNNKESQKTTKNKKESSTFEKLDTIHKDIKDALKDSEERYRALSNATFEAIFISEKGFCIDANQSASDMFGFTHEEFIGIFGTDVITSEYKELVKNKMLAGNEESYEAAGLRKDGSTFPVQIQARMMDYKGKRVRVTAVRDFTHYKKAQEAIKISEEKFRQLFENSLDAIFWANPETKVIINCNNAAEILLEKERSEIIGKHQTSIHPTEKADLYKEMFQKHTDENGSFDEAVILTKTGKIIPVDISASVVVVGGEQIMQGIFRNITDQKKAEEDLRKLNEELEFRVIDRTNKLQELNKEMEAFAYSISHDLRAPLRGINGFSNILLKDYLESLDEKGKDYLKRIGKATQHMDDLIQHLLELPKISRTDLKLVNVNLSNIVNEILTRFHIDEPERITKFKIEKDLIVNGDESLLKVMLENLIENAWKFSKKKPKTEISFGIAKEIDNGRVYFVKDHGIGFDMKYVEKLFLPFQRLHSEKEYQGTGIGLATVQRILKKHDGKVWAESQPLNGTTIYFTLPNN